MKDQALNGSIDRHGLGIKRTRPFLVLAALLAGLVVGLLATGASEGARSLLVQSAGLIGELWLDALKMTVIPLVFALLVTGVARSAEAAKAGRVAARTVAWVVAICTASAVAGALLIQLLLQAFPLSSAAAEALRGAIAAAPAKDAPIAGAAEVIRAIIPTNVFAAASNGDVLPLVVFGMFFAVAVSRIAVEQRRSLVGFFEATSNALLMIIGWVLWAAPLGVFALAIALAADAGGAAFAGLAHYVVLLCAVGAAVTLFSYPLATLFGGVRLAEYTRAMLPPQSVAISTRSSLASLPAMLTSARALGVREEVADVTLPIAVALFRATGPAMNVAVAFYVAHWVGLEPSFAQMVAATAVGAVMSYASVSLPGEVSFISSIAPIAIALGVPVGPLGLLIAVEMIPDIFRTLGNVSMDVAVTAAVDRSSRQGSAAGDFPDPV